MGQTITRTARPLCTLRAARQRADWAGLNRLVKEWRPDAMVVGLPLTLQGGDQPLTVAARRFMRQLERRYRLPVYGKDERFTTLEAKRQAAFDESLDPIAARIILEEWLQTRARNE